MKVGILLSNYDALPIGTGPSSAQLAGVGRLCEGAGFDRLFLCDHQWCDLSPVGDGSTDRPMLDPFVALGVLAGATSSIGLGTLVSGVHFRPPAILIKQVTTLDILSNGRSYLGVGAGWYGDECRGLGIPFPPLGDRVKSLDSLLQLVLAMWSDDATRYSTAPEVRGSTFVAQRALCSPPPARRPHPPILVGGNGHLTILPLAARYADVCNLVAPVISGYDDPNALLRLRRCLEVLEGHCSKEGRQLSDIELTVLVPWQDLSSSTTTGFTLNYLNQLSELGFDAVIVSDDMRSGKSLFRCLDWIDVWGEVLIPACSMMDGRR